MSGSNTVVNKEFVNDPYFSDISPKYVNKIYIALGTNDASQNESESKMWNGVLKPKFLENYKTIYDSLAAQYGTANISFVIMPPCQTTGYLTKERCEEYADAARELAVQNQISFVDIRTKIKQGDNIHTDGVHLNDLGNQYYYELIAAEVGELPQFFVHWASWHYCQQEGGVYNKHTNECEV